MKIKITKDLPVPDHARPAIGSTYEVVDSKRLSGQPIGRRRIYFIMVAGERVGVYPEECEIVEEE